MNMISTGAFLPEMDASNKQETVAEKFARVWEKKNAKAARAGGVSLMALSLAACGSDSEEAVVETDTTPFDQADIDAAVDAALAEAALNNPTVTDFAVSAAGDRIEGTDGADTVTFTNAQFDAEDQLIDDSTGDGDVVNVTLTAAGGAASISGFEQINVTLDVLAGVAFDATNVTGATIDVSSTRLGYDGAATVTAAGANDVTTSGGVTDLTVTDLSTGTIDASGLDSATIDAADFSATATARTTTVTVDGDIDLNVDMDTFAATNDFTLDITATAAAVVTLNLTNGAGAGAGAVAIGDDGSITINNTGDVTLAFDADELEADAAGIAAAGTSVSVNGGTVDIVANTSGSLGLGGFDVDEVQVSVATALNLTAVNGQTIVVDVEDATLNIDGAAATDSVTINVLDDQGGAGSAIDASDSLGTVNLNVGADSGTDRVDTLLAVTVDGDLNLSMAQDLTITTLTNSTGTDTVAVSGTGDLTITNAVLMGTGGFDASALVGGVTATNTDVSGSFIGGSGDDTITTANNLVGAGNTFEATLGAGDDTVTGTSVTTATLIVNGGAGDDTVTADGLTSGTLVASMGAGDDTITLGAVAGGAATITIDGGAGEDTLDLGAGGDLTGATVAITGIEHIDVDNGSSINASDITGMAVNITGNGTAGATLTIADDSTGSVMTLDLSGLTFDATMAAGASGTVIAITNADQVTLSAEDDALTITGVVGTYTDVDSSGTINDGDTFEGDFAVITGYNQGTVAAGAITAPADTGHDNINGAGAADEVAVDGTWNATTQTFTADDDGADCLVYSATAGECAVFVGVTDLII